MYEERLDLYNEAEGICEVCRKPVSINDFQIAHRIPNSQTWLKKYGKEIIDSKLNKAVTHAECNAKVLLVNRPIEREILIDRILATIDRGGIMGNFDFMKDYDVSAYKLSPVVLKQHQYNLCPIGRMVFMGSVPDHIEYFDKTDGETYKKLEEIEAIEFDPGYMVHEDGRKELFEISIVVRHPAYIGAVANNHRGHQYKEVIDKGK
jgi:hypothetical protein